MPRHSQRKMLNDEHQEKNRRRILRADFCRTKSTFFGFFEDSKKQQICNANFSVITATTEKMGYATTLPKENA